MAGVRQEAGTPTMHGFLHAFGFCAPSIVHWDWPLNLNNLKTQGRVLVLTSDIDIQNVFDVQDGLDWIPVEKKADRTS